jgi:hypothetical protein
MLTCVTPSELSQATIGVSVWCKVLYLRTCWRRFPARSPGVRTATATIFLPTSIAATRSYMISTLGPFPKPPLRRVTRRARMNIKSLRLALW